MSARGSFCWSVLLVVIFASPASAGRCLPVQLYPQLYGGWRWVQTVDWFADTIDTPESVGHTHALMIHSDGSWTRVTDEELMSTGEWCVRGCNIDDAENFDCELGRNYLWLGSSEDAPDGQGWHAYEVDVGAEVTLTTVPLDGFKSIHYVQDANVPSRRSSWGALKVRY